MAIIGSLIGTMPAEAFTLSHWDRDGARGYEEILDELYSVLSTGEGLEKEMARAVGLYELNHALGREEALQSTGFSIEDITGDGVPELLVGSMPSSGKSVYAVYTLQNGRPIPVFSGWARNGYYSLGGDRFYHYGSGGASYSAFGTFHLSHDGSHMEWEDFYFSDIIDESTGAIGYFHNTTGLWDKAEGERMFLPNNRFMDLSESFWAETKVMELVPFSYYEEQREMPALTGKAAVLVTWADKGMEEGFDCREFTANENPETRLLFWTERNVSDFSVLRLYPHIDESGKCDFSYEPIYKAGSLESMKDAVVVNMTFYGDTPSYGISYEDSDGETKCFALNISGKDGSLVLEKI